MIDRYKQVIIVSSELKLELFDSPRFNNQTAIINWGMPKHIWAFWSPKKCRKVAIFGQIWSNFELKKVFFVCNKLLHLAILEISIYTSRYAYRRAGNRTTAASHNQTPKLEI